MLLPKYYTVTVLNDAVVGGKAHGCVMEATEAKKVHKMLSLFSDSLLSKWKE